MKSGDNSTILNRLRILAVGAHPDDLEILCGGTLAKYAHLGQKIIMCHVNNGDKGHFEIKSEELVKIREKEAKNSAKLVDAESFCLNIPDGE